MAKTDRAKDRNPFMAATKRMTKGKKKPAGRTGALGTPKKKKTVAKRKTKKTSR